MNPRHIVEAELVDLVGGHVAIGIVGELRGVIIGAIRQPPDAIIGGGHRLLADHFAAQLLVGDLRVGVPRIVCAGLEVLLGRGVEIERVDLAPKVLQHRIVEPLREQIVDIGDDIGVDPVGRHDAVVGALGRLARIVLQHAPHVRDARDIGLGVRGLGHTVDVDEEGRQPRLLAEHLVEEEAVTAERLEPLFHRQIAQEEIVADAVLHVERRAIELRLHRIGGVLHEAQLRDVVGFRHIAPGAVILVDDAAIGLGRRREFELHRVVILEQGREPRIGGRLGAGGGGELARLGRRAGGGGGEQGGGKRQADHAVNLL